MLNDYVTECWCPENSRSLIHINYENFFPFLSSKFHLLSFLITILLLEFSSGSYQPRPVVLNEGRRGDFAPPGHLAMFGDIFDGYN